MHNALTLISFVTLPRFPQPLSARKLNVLHCFIVFSSCHHQVKFLYQILPASPWLRWSRPCCKSRVCLMQSVTERQLVPPLRWETQETGGRRYICLSVHSPSSWVCMHTYLTDAHTASHLLCRFTQERTAQAGAKKVEEYRGWQS